MVRKCFLKLILSFLLFLPSVVEAVPPMPYKIGGTVTVNGTILDQTTDTGYTVAVTKANGSSYSPAAEDTDGLNASNWYIINIPIYDDTDQPGGANPGETAVIHVYKDGLEVGLVTLPTDGEIIIGNSGSTNEIHLEVESNQPPTADAGPDQTVREKNLATLDGSNSSDVDDGIASYQWTQTGGTSVVLSNASAVQPTFVTPEVGTDGEALTFQLTVTDNGGLESTDTCIVNVSSLGTSIVVLTDTETYYVSADSSYLIYGTKGDNKIVIESGADVKTAHFPGNNTVEFETDADQFSVLRSGATVILSATDGTRLKIPASGSVQTIKFKDNISLDLLVNSNQVLLGTQVVTTTFALIDVGIDDEPGEYDGFAISESKISYGSDYDQVCKNEFGSEWRIADWSELEEYYSNGADLDKLVEGVGFDDKINAWVTRYGNQSYSSSRDYFASYHNHNKSSSYLAHDNIDNYFLSLGSWYSSYYVLCSCEDDGELYGPWVTQNVSESSDGTLTMTAIRNRTEYAYKPLTWDGKSDIHVSFDLRTTSGFSYAEYIQLGIFQNDFTETWDWYSEPKRYFHFGYADGQSGMKAKFSTSDYGNAGMNPPTNEWYTYSMDYNYLEQELVVRFKDSAGSTMFERVYSNLEFDFVTSDRIIGLFSLAMDSNYGNPSETVELRNLNVWF